MFAPEPSVQDRLEVIFASLGVISTIFIMPVKPEIVDVPEFIFKVAILQPATA